MRNINSVQELVEINSLLTNIRKEYEKGIKPVLRKNNPSIFIANFPIRDILKTPLPNIT